MKLFPAARSTLREYWVVLLAPFLLFVPLLVRGEVLFWGTPALQFVPWWVSALRSLSQGSLPLWNPLNGMGTPLLANYQAAFLYPPNWTLLLFGWAGEAAGIALGYTLLAAAHLAWAGWGMARLLKRLEFKWLGQIIGGLAFGLSGYLVARLGFFSMVWTAAWIPWVIFEADKIASPYSPPGEAPSSQGKLLPAKIPFGLILVLAMQLFAGHAQLAWYSILLGASWVTAGALIQKSFRRVLQTWLAFGLAVLAAAGIAAVQLWPTFQFLKESARSSAYAFEDAMTYSFWPWRVLTLFSPDFFGSPAHGDYWGYASYWEDHLYVGILPLVMAAATFRLLLRGIRPAKRDSRWLLVAFCWLFLGISFLLALGKNTPVFPFLYWHIPTFNMFQAPARYLIWASFVIPILAAVAIERWRNPTGRGLYWFRLGTAGAFAVTLGAGLAPLVMDTVRLTFIRATALTGLWGLVAGLMTLVIPWVQKHKKVFFWQEAAILAVLVDLLLIGWELNPGAQLALFGRQPLPVDLSGTGQSGQRIYLSLSEEYDLKFRRFLRFKDFRPLEDWSGMRKTFLPDLNLLDDISSVNNFDPLVTSRYKRWIDALEQLDPQTRSAWLAFSNTGWIERIDVSKDSGVRFDRLAGAERLHWYSCSQLVKDSSAAWKLLQQEMQAAPNPNRRVILEIRGTFTGEESCKNEQPAALRLISEKSDRLTVEIHTSQGGWLEVTDTWYPDWTARVSGRKAEVVPADSLFRAVYVPAGTQLVEFSYSPVGFYLTGMLSILVLLCIMFLWKREGNNQGKGVGT